VRKRAILPLAIVCLVLIVAAIAVYAARAQVVRLSARARSAVPPIAAGRTSLPDLPRR
jgi:CHASE3 domain sensor protein